MKLTKTHCQRCGKEIYKTEKSLYGLDNLKNQIGDICKNCTTEDEKHEINLAVGQGILEGGNL